MSFNPITQLQAWQIFQRSLETIRFPIYDEYILTIKKEANILFILEAFTTLRESYVFYFSSFMLLGISVIIAVGRCYQALYKEKINKWWYYLVEVFVQIIRIIQYVLIISLGTETPTSAFTSTEFWDKIFLSLYEMTFPAILWDFVGFVIVFGIYNLILYMVFTKHSIAGFMKKREITTFSVEASQLAIILTYKNLLLIPVSFIYILIILKII
jgi:hypothetical protein